MSPFDKLQEAIQSGTPEEVKAARIAWQAHINRRCDACGETGKPIHRFMGGRDLVCEDCDEDIRRGYEEWDDQLAHERMHAAGRP